MAQDWNYANYPTAQAAYGAFSGGLPAGWDWGQWLAAQPTGTLDPRTHSSSGEKADFTWNPNGPGYLYPQTGQVISGPPGSSVGSTNVWSDPSRYVNTGAPATPAPANGGGSTTPYVSTMPPGTASPGLVAPETSGGITLPPSSGAMPAGRGSMVTPGVNPVPLPTQTTGDMVTPSNGPGVSLPTDTQNVRTMGTGTIGKSYSPSTSSTGYSNPVFPQPIFQQPSAGLATPGGKVVDALARRKSRWNSYQ